MPAMFCNILKLYYSPMACFLVKYNLNSSAISIIPFWKLSFLFRSKKSNNVTNATTQSGKDKNNTEDDANAVTPECNEKTCSEFVEKLVSEHVSETEWRSMFKIYFLESSTVPLRWQLHSLLCVFWKQISESNQLKLLDILWALYDESPVFGKRASQLIDVLGYLTMSGKVSADRMRSYAIKMVEIMRHQNEALDNHPNFSLYEKLLKLVEFDGFYLESDACLVCHGKETAMSLIKLSSIKADSRFTTTTQIIKLISPHQIASIVCRISDINNSKMVKSMAIYYNKRTVASVVELKNNPQVWHRARKVSLEAGQILGLSHYTPPPSPSPKLAGQITYSPPPPPPNHGKYTIIGGL